MQDNERNGESAAKPYWRDTVLSNPRLLNRTAEVFKGLNQPTTIRIINLLLQEPEGLTVTDLCKKMEATKSKVSCYLPALKTLGVIQYKSIGRYNHYRLTDTFRKFFEFDPEMAATTKTSEWFIRRMASFVVEHNHGSLDL